MQRHVVRHHHHLHRDALGPRQFGRQTEIQPVAGVVLHHQHRLVPDGRLGPVQCGVRQRPGMFIGDTGPRGLHHLIFEVVDQSGKTKVGEDGKPVVWGIELGPAATIAQQGVTVEAFQPGTVITVTLNPLRNGKNFGAMASGARLIKCGTAIPAGGCTDKTGEVFLQSRDGFGTQRAQQPGQ